MAMCEDFPCCGHEMGCCPDYDESGKQLNMVCVCGAKLPLNSRYSICTDCLREFDDDENEGFDDGFEDDFDFEEKRYVSDFHEDCHDDFEEDFDSWVAGENALCQYDEW
jgi:hypothetical protein